ncbi:uncharacterized protein LOC112602904 [Melanaphis sacchari]|uniref:uncharacterized protein LOC112602904 n=1 Tax=Melanaphis sacchari TaxID=742174 RepID=UPI000DC15A97|nr:uncharacterized protein LOC112602904 [Melanaphis sacchari]
MNSFIFFMTFVLTFQWINCNANNTSKLGISPCMYAGDFDSSGYYCPTTTMNISLLPSNCTSFVYEGFNYDYELNIMLPGHAKGNIISLCTSGKPVYLYLDYAEQMNWMNEVKNASTSTIKVLNLVNMLDKHNITGLILKNLNSYPPQDGNFDESFYKNLTNYVTVLKTSSVFSEVGLFINASDMIYHRNNPKAPGWLDYDKWLNNIMDYYIISFDKFNPCNDKFKTGIVPLNDSNVQTNNTLAKFLNVLKDSKMLKDKIYLEFSLSPTVNDTTNENLPTCCVSYKKYCEPGNYNLFWCADNADAFFQKGKFARDVNAKGIVAKYIDTSDPTGNCGCDNQNQFITYSMIFRGFLNQAPITDCQKLNQVTKT